MTDAVASNAANRMTLSVEWSANGTTGWRTLVGGNWVGGRLDRLSSPRRPRIGYGASDIAPGFLRAVAETNLRFVWAIEMEIV
jgi:hypothetical protein